MRTVYHDEFSDDRRTLLRRRVAGVVLALAIEIGVVLLLLYLGPPKFGRPEGDGRPNTFVLTPDAQEKKASKTQSKQQRKATVTKAAPPPPPVPPVPIGHIPGLIELSHDEFAAADIGKIKSAPGADKGELASGEGDSEAIGTGPHGEPLYKAEWYREPTSAETGPYIPKGLRSGSALIACKTAPKYRVEDCVILGDRPPGTGLARGIRDAAFQFRVIPPRKGGQPLIGAWVQILFTIVPHEDER